MRNKFVSACLRLSVIFAATVKTLGQCGDGENLAFHKPAFQSSTLPSKDLIPYPERGVDGNTSPDFKSCNTCFHTDQESAPWWMVDLEQDYVISGVEITNRGDNVGKRFKQFYIEVSREYSSSKGMIEPLVCAGPFTSQPGGSTVSYPCNSTIVGRYVRVTSGRARLSLCEVKVFGSSSGNITEQEPRSCQNHFTAVEGLYPSADPIHSERTRTKAGCAQRCSITETCTSFSVTKYAKRDYGCSLFNCDQIQKTSLANTTYFLQTRWKLQIQ